MPGPRPLDILEFLEFGIAVDDLQGQRTAKRCPPPKTGEKTDRVGLNPLSPTPTIPTLPPPEFGVNHIGINGQASRKPIHQCRQSRPMRFTSSPVTQPQQAIPSGGVTEQGVSLTGQTPTGNTLSLVGKTVSP